MANPTSVNVSSDGYRRISSLPAKVWPDIIMSSRIVARQPTIPTTTPVSYTHLDVYKRQDHGLNVNEITRRTSLSRPAISHHLKILKDAGLVGVRQEGTANYYYLTLRESNRILMELGYRLEEFLY